MKTKILKNTWSFLLIAFLATACSAPFHSRRLISHVVVSQASLSEVASADSGAIAACCSGSVNQRRMAVAPHPVQAKSPFGLTW